MIARYLFKLHQGAKIAGYKINGGIFNSAEKVEFNFKLAVRRLYLFKIDWEPKSHFLKEIENVDIFLSGRNAVLSTDALSSGMYILQADENACFKFYVNPQKRCSIGVVVPIFTEWGYHHDGFYWNEHRRLPHYFTAALQRLHIANGLIDKLEKAFPDYFYYPYYYPFHKRISINNYYIQNHRWNHSRWLSIDPFFNGLDGLWSEEYKAGIPLVALLQKLNINVSFFSDVHVHKNDPELLKMDKLIFYSGELMTREMFNFFCNAQRNNKTKILFWGMGAMGLKEIEYDEEFSRLEFKGQKGAIGLSGEKVSCRVVSWKDEDGKIFGFKFPTPQRRDWRTMHTVLKLDAPQDLLLKGISSQEICFNADCNGEFFEKANPDAQIIAHLDNFINRIGIGRYGIFTHVAPTYLSAYGAYHYDLMPEISLILANWINA